MTKVYLVKCIEKNAEYEEMDYIIGAYSTREMAEDAKKSYEKYDGKYCNYWISTMDLDLNFADEA